MSLWEEMKTKEETIKENSKRLEYIYMSLERLESFFEGILSERENDKYELIEKKLGLITFLIRELNTYINYQEKMFDDVGTSRVLTTGTTVNNRESKHQIDNKIDNPLDNFKNLAGEDLK
jgi:hypothetical protein